MAGCMSSLAQISSVAQLSGSEWAHNLLTECATAMSNEDLAQAQQLLWVLNELSSPHGSHDQRLAYYFMQALFCKLSGNGIHNHISLCTAADRSSSFESMRKTMLKFQETSPWVTFGHVAANGAIMEAMEGEAYVHIIDMSNTFCTQWPTLLEALATRAEGAPNVRLSAVVFSDGDSRSWTKVMEEVGARLDKFARLMGVPFQFNLFNYTELDVLLQQEAASRAVQYAHMSSGIIDGSVGDAPASSRFGVEALAINCMQSLHRIPYSKRHALLCKLHNLGPKIVTVVEDDAHIVPIWDATEYNTDDDHNISTNPDSSFINGFSEALHFFSLFFNSLADSLPKTSSERLALERGAGRSIMHIVACDHHKKFFTASHEAETLMERREKSSDWRERLQGTGFVPRGLSDDVLDDVRALLKRYKEDWGLAHSHDHHLDGITLTWKDQNVVFFSAWRPLD